MLVAWSLAVLAAAPPAAAPSEGDAITELDPIVEQAKRRIPPTVVPGAWNRLALLGDRPNARFSLMGRAWSPHLGDARDRDLAPVSDVGLAIVFTPRRGWPSLFLGVLASTFPGVRTGIGATAGILWPIPSLGLRRR